jgi:hypothetical protein
MDAQVKETVYLDATVPSYYYDQRESIRTFAQVTRRWWREERDRFRLVSSLATIAELQRGDYPRRSEVVRLAAGLEMLRACPDVTEIATAYVDSLVMPRDAEGDALHLAYASYYNVDFLPTWNCNHLANANKEQHIRSVNGRLHLHTPRIITPLELFEERPYP